MGKYSEGKNSQTVGLSFATNAPLDDRTVVKTKDSLIGKDTWVQPGYLFNGLITAVQETQELYMYIGGSLSAWPSDFLSTTTATTSTAQDTTIAKYWKKVSSSGLENLSGVFQFKGMAYDISPDSSYILLNNDGFDLTPLGIACDIVGNTYFGWGIDSTEIWTAGPLWKNAVKYTKSDTSTTVYGMTINDTLYFVSSTQPKPNDGTLLESLDGRYVFFDKGLGSIEGAFGALSPIKLPICDSEGTCTDTIVSGYVFKYDAYTFTKAKVQEDIPFYVTPLLASDGTKTDGDGNKIPNNSGHVYQIGENEYASNGQIWVKLGSPVEDWIIL